MAASQVFCPGDVIYPELLLNQQGSSKALTLGPGLRYIPPSTICAMLVGSVAVDSRKNAIWLETNGHGRVRRFDIRFLTRTLTKESISPASATSLLQLCTIPLWMSSIAQSPPTHPSPLYLSWLLKALAKRHAQCFNQAVWSTHALQSLTSTWILKWNVCTPPQENQMASVNSRVA